MNQWHLVTTKVRFSYELNKKIYKTGKQFNNFELLLSSDEKDFNPYLGGIHYGLHSSLCLHER